ncbi:hypothetical protein [Hoeflea olei]|uniref:Uncharacterized protein n=1 Tax=Hoeflea olei TaxID=1480615 RepID=A0A1C1YSF9_9HYPH|nr:hypothetical protein [Hoeflea olei]OCW56300.1 hypothetical protein AWJ14_19590 [Hoeflea olei]
MATKYIPKPWKCSTAENFEYDLSRAADRIVKATGLTAAEIQQTYPSIRPYHLRALDNGETLGIRMAFAIIETLGGDVEVRA